MGRQSPINQSRSPYAVVLIMEKGTNKKNWIKGAIKRPGALTKKAKAEGKTVSQYCAKKRSGRTAKQCALAKTLKKMKKK